MKADIDIDTADRDALLDKIKHISASQENKDGEFKRHNVGVYFQSILTDPLTGFSSIPYKEAEKRNYFKIDILNVQAYGLNKVRDEEHLNELIEREPMWELLEYEDIVNQLFQLNGHFDILSQYKPKSVKDLAMVIALVRPGKRHLIGQPLEDIKDEIWEPTKDYYFKKSHSLSYSLAIVVQMNLLVEETESS